MENDWTVSEDRPGYRCKTIKKGNCTIIIYRPILTPEEQAKREKQVMDTLESVMREELIRKGQKA